MSANNTSSTDRAVEDAFSSEDLALIGFSTIWHQMPYLSARRLIEFDSTRWPVWCPYNIQRISEARREDDTRDWYFPIHFRRPQVPIDQTRNSWSWSGVHHLSEAEIVPRPHSLPPLAYLPLEWISFTHTDVIAGSGGLLLIRNQPDFRTPSSISQSKWKRLVVCNPLRREWRELPAADSGDLRISSRDYRNMQAQIVVDDAGSSYKVILTSINFVCVYKSLSNSWTCRPFPSSGPWRYCNFAWRYASASANVGERFLFAEIEVDRVSNASYVRVFEIDEEAATWQLHNQYTLLHQDFRQSSSVLHYCGPEIKFDRCLEMVECMGQIYAVIAAMSCPATSILVIDNFEVMPLQFIVYQLHGAGHAHGTLDIRVPHAAGDIQIRRDSISARSSRNDLHIWNWFKCTARGSVIWVSFEDYLLQYNVVTRQSKSQIIPGISQFHFAARFSYRPSFHMRP